MSNVRYVKYVSGKSITLHKALKDGRDVFEAGVVYEIENYSDFMRLTKVGDFVQVNADGSPFVPAPVEAVVVTPVVLGEVATDEPADEPVGRRRRASGSAEE